MSRTQKVSKTPPPALDREYWLRFGDNADPSVRERMLYVTVGEIGRRGPLDTNARWVCDLVGVKYPMVNYYFGSWDALLAEAILYAYREWYRTMVESLAKPAKTPRERFKNVIHGELARVRRLGGVIPLSAYPVLSESVHDQLLELGGGFPEEMTEWSVLAVAVLIKDLRTGKRTEIEFIPGAVPRTKMMATMPKELIASASAQWSISGLTMWASGGHLSGAKMRDLPAAFSEKLAMAAHIDRILDSFEFGT